MLSSWVSSIYLNCWNKCKIANSPAASSLLGPQSASQSYVQYIWPLYSIIYFRNLPPSLPGHNSCLLPENTHQIFYFTEVRGLWDHLENTDLKYSQRYLQYLHSTAPFVFLLMLIVADQLHSFYVYVSMYFLASIPFTLIFNSQVLQDL